MGSRTLIAVVASLLLLPGILAAQAPRAGAPGNRGGAVFGPHVQPHRNPLQSPLPRDLVPPAPPSALAPPLPAGPGFARRSFRDPFRAGPRTYDPRFNSVPYYPYAYGGYAGAGGYAPTEFGYVSDLYTDSRRLYQSDQQRQAEIGALRFQVQPDSTQIFVDGLYVGTIQDFGAYARERTFDAGTHRVELRADGYETATVDVRVSPNETVTLRRDLRRAEAAVLAPVAKAQPKTFYVIPRCYAGTSRPQQDQLPKGCLVANLKVVPPEVSSATVGR